MNNLNIDQTIKYVKNILENVQCLLCDKLDGHQLRYPCGHTACDDCAANSEDCQICLIPPQDTNIQPKLDDVFTQRVKNASLLRKTCEKLFNTDVYKHKRLSEQLRIEKELFPECIQAPAKYENKRRSTLFSNKNKNKENRISKIFPGEETSLPNENITMENSVRYVHQWLNNIDNDMTRRPFRDLNVNTQVDHGIIIPKSNNILQNTKDKHVKVINRNRKRAHFKTTLKNVSPLSSTLKSKINEHVSSSKRVKKELHQSEDVAKTDMKSKCDNDESGIFMDNDPILIDDSQEVEIDKDKNAWLAVLEANENEENESTSVVNLDYKQTPRKSNRLQNKANQNIKVPFYKKSYITEKCTYCNAADYKAPSHSKEVKIVIDSVNFITTVKILNDVENSSKLNTTKSISVQTDNCETIDKDQNVEIKDNINTGFKNLHEKYGSKDLTSQKSETQSVDLFEDEGQNIENTYKKNNQHDFLVISESDSDMEMEASGPLPVKVDVHRSCDESEYGILSEVVNIQEHDTKPRRGPRGLTPTSTDSSEKENFNPNRMKKHISKKKKYLKK